MHNQSNSCIEQVNVYRFNNIDSVNDGWYEMIFINDFTEVVLRNIIQAIQDTKPTGDSKIRTIKILRDVLGEIGITHIVSRGTSVKKPSLILCKQLIENGFPPKREDAIYVKR